MKQAKTNNVKKFSSHRANHKQYFNEIGKSTSTRYKNNGRVFTLMLNKAMKTDKSNETNLTKPKTANEYSYKRITEQEIGTLIENKMVT